MIPNEKRSTYQQAIDILTTNGGMHHRGITREEHLMAVQSAIRALHHEVEREGGCRLCTSRNIDIKVETKGPDDGYYFSSQTEVGLMYCPLCGRKLSGNRNGEI